MSALTLDDLNAIQPLSCEPVAVPELGDGKVMHVAELSADEAEARIGKPWQGKDDMTGFRAFAIAACWCNEQRQFVAASVPEIERAAAMIGKQKRLVIERLYDAVARLNGLDIAENPEKN